MAHISNRDDAADVRQALLHGTRTVVLEDQNSVGVTCPHPGCEETASAPAPDAETEMTVTRRTALIGDYENVRCPAGHSVFVHYCEAL